MFNSRTAQNLSIGEKQRAAFARTLANEPEILLLDEPTASLDPSAQKVIEHLIIRLHSEFSLTTVLVTHDLEQARRLSKHSAIIINGSIVECGLTEKILYNPEGNVCKEFLEGRFSDAQ